MNGATQRRAVGLLAVIASLLVGGVLLWRGFGAGSEGDTTSGRESTTSTVWPAPAPGEAVAGFLDDGTPVLAAGHEDGSFTAIEAVSPHRAWGVKSLLGWCPSSRTFDDPFHGSRFDEYGRYLAGPAPTGPVRLSVRALPGDPARIRLGPPIAPLPRTAHASSPHGAVCAGATLAETGLLVPSVAASGLTPAGLLQTAPPAGSRWSVAAVLVARTDSPVRLCAAVLADGRCRAGAEVDNFPQSFLPAGEGLRVSALWLVLVEDGALADPIRAA